MNDSATERIVRPRLRTTIERFRRTAGNHLPGDLLEEQVQRLGILVGVCAGLWIFGLLMDTIVVPHITGRSMPAWTPILDVGGIVVSAAAFGYVRYIGGSCQAKIDAALGFMIWNAAAIAVLSTSRLPAIQPYQLSWTTVVILTSAMMIPATPAKMLFASAAAASMDPIAVAIAHLLGGPVSPLGNMVLAFLPNYACAAIAVVPSYALTHKIGRAHVCTPVT